MDQINVPQFFTLGQKVEDNDLVRFFFIIVQIETNFWEYFHSNSNLENVSQKA